ncbi:ribbon-helix-helix protein, CopG family [Nonomuraea ceibae]|uniref:ribbon-helix-helix protein, CopG family n=1 Tax=Nonomuraea ceibae TaxID=1935170 RepID=UPI001C5FA03B|nr:ribbon-helix-helix protein, CopG family [Nonomuraea ceibae]
MSLYLPEDMKHRVAEAARAHGLSEEDYMRDAIARVLSDEIVVERRQRVSLPVFEVGDEPVTAERLDDILAEGYGRDGLD